MIINDIDELKKTEGFKLEYYESQKNKCIFLKDIQSPYSGSGFGKEAIRLLFQLSGELGYLGNIELIASYSSHIFYLKMGFIPKNEKIIQQFVDLLLTVIKFDDDKYPDTGSMIFKYNNDFVRSREKKIRRQHSK